MFKSLPIAFKGFLFKRGKSARKAIVVVSGLPRSGTSMMMKMLEAGGVPVLTDLKRGPDADNPKGYYEYEAVKKLPAGETAWLAEARGKAVKIIVSLLPYLPDSERYKVFFMTRRMEEILASQRKMLARRGEKGSAIPDDEMTAHFEKHVQEVKAWMTSQKNLAFIEVDYNSLVDDPRGSLGAFRGFLDCALDFERMAGVVDPSLYRNR